MKELLLIALTLGTVACLNTDFTKVNLVFVGTNQNDTKILTKDDNFAALSNTVYFNVNRKTMIYVPGWRLSCNTSFAQSVITAYLTRRTEFNIICVDWSNYTYNFVFITTLQSLDGVSSYTKDILNQMKSQLFPNTNHYIHLVGFNVGAHLAGYIGRKFSVNRITGLDPIGAFMYTKVIFTFAGVSALSSWDAPQVDIIHTSKGKFGFPDPTGHLDFHVNGGCTQCGCSFIGSIKAFLKDQRIENIYTLACSHARAVEYYVESVYRNATRKPFIAAACDLTTSVYSSSKCSNNNKQVSMGFYAAPPVCGFMDFDCVSTNYLVETNSDCPYSMH